MRPSCYAIMLLLLVHMPDAHKLEATLNQLDCSSLLFAQQSA